MKNKEAAERWKRRFAAELCEIRRRVQNEELLAAQAAANETLAPRSLRNEGRKRARRSAPRRVQRWQNYA